ncbi:polyprenyl synthetase family protein [Thiomicrorhabdus sp. zzn3]|uniref:polyprenyl synthetase family protein n=1 Tax=Thiomicrorhabdus sp. zzn3 TaxID=3039775 RepID=UPI002436993C|nr:farnesyl diphosphate synthase [Thiomicrorhabdus sp. zzn3]MDG6777782.1 polyprenyl synthetase family protein [Thiomicrorhabdus sp. zzn3]
MQQQLNFYQERIHTQLTGYLQQESLNQFSPKLNDALHYATLNGGKRLRPALIYAVGESLEIPINKLDSAACAIELIHSYSLVHDDLPAMDDDDLRRGQATCHIAFDEATAILVGDAQQALAFQILSQDHSVSDTHKVKLIQLLSQASGARGMIGGQMIDLESENQDLDLETLQTLHQMKTGALLKAALLMGAVQSSRFNELESGLRLLGESIGLAFQVQDDILDIEGETETLGKPQGSDLQAGKSTYPKLMGLEASKSYRDKLILQAKTQFEALNINSPFLAQLIDYIAKRNH